MKISVLIVAYIFEIGNKKIEVNDVNFEISSKISKFKVKRTRLIYSDVCNLHQLFPKSFFLKSERIV